MGVLPAFAVPSKHLGPAENSRAFDLGSREHFFFQQNYGLASAWTGADIRMVKYVIHGEGSGETDEQTEELLEYLFNCYCYRIVIMAHFVKTGEH